MIRESWLTEISPDSPCGPDLEYDQDFLALEQAARGKEEQQYGDTIIPAAEPVWSEVVERASSLLDRTRDLRVTHLLTRGLTHLDGLAGLALGLGLARGLLDRFWEPLHPSLLFDGEPDPVFRMNAIAALAANDGLLRDVRSAPFVRTPSISLTVQDVHNIFARSPEGAGADELRATVRDVLTANATELGDAGSALEHVNAIRSRLLAQLDPTLVPDLGPLVNLLAPLAGLVAQIRRELAPAAEEGAADGTATAATPRAARAPGEIATREDALRALDRVCDFLGRSEPTNPAPLLIRRAQRLMTMSFLDIIRDLAPDATGQVETITGAGSQSS